MFTKLRVSKSMYYGSVKDILVISLKYGPIHIERVKILIYLILLIRKVTFYLSTRLESSKTGQPISVGPYVIENDVLQIDPLFTYEFHHKLFDSYKCFHYTKYGTLLPNKMFHYTKLGSLLLIRAFHYTK